MDKLQHNRELVSALADGHLRGDEFACAVEVTVADADARATWHAYHLVGDTLRASDLAQCGVRDGFMARLQQRLEAEPCYSATLKVQAQVTVASFATATAIDAAANASVFRWKLVAGFASFAAVLAVSLSQLSGAGTERGNAAGLLASAQTSVPTAGAASVTVAAKLTDDAPANAPPVMIRDPHLDALLAAHKQFGGASALQGPAGFLRNATFDASGR